MAILAIIIGHTARIVVSNIVDRHRSVARNLQIDNKSEIHPLDRRDADHTSSHAVGDRLKTDVNFDIDSVFRIFMLFIVAIAVHSAAFI